MTSKTNYPYEFVDLDPEELAEVLQHYDKGYRNGYTRIGPKGYFYASGYKADAANIYNMALRPDDIFVVTFPKSGTTWTQELVWMIGNNFDYEKAQATVLQKRFPFLEMSSVINNEKSQKAIRASVKDDDRLQGFLETLSVSGPAQVAGLPSPRFMKSHLPLSLLPPALLQQARVVYVARDPRDVAVSYYYHHKLMKATGYQGNFKQFWNYFIQGRVNLSPYFPHVLEAWEQRHHPNMLFMFYEDMLKDLPSAVRRVAEFLGKEVSEDQVAKLCDHLSFHNFKNNQSVNYEFFKDLGLANEDHTFMRKGKSGDWRDHFDAEMAAQAQRWIEDNLRGTDLRLPSYRDDNNQ